MKKVAQLLLFVGIISMAGIFVGGCEEGNGDGNGQSPIVTQENPDLAEGVDIGSKTVDDAYVTADEALQIVCSEYSDLDFGNEVMSGYEQVGDKWIAGYMFSAVEGDDVVQVIVDGISGKIVKEVILPGYTTRSACVISGIAFGAWYSQNNPSWSSVLLGNSSSVTIGAAGCVITSLSMAYHNVWGVSTTPPQLNTSAKNSGCFGPGSPDVVVSCAINSRGGPHSVSDISMSSVATAICSGYPVMVDVNWGGGHKMLVYYYTGGSTTSMSSYYVVDPWDGTSKSLSSYTATRWRKLY